MKDQKQLLESLKAELASIEKGGYGRSPQQPWRAKLVFEDSPCCPNYGDRERRVPCEKCVLMQFVPQDRREEKVPCRFIPLNTGGETIDSLYRCGTQAELETAVRNWLQETIQRLEQEMKEQPACIQATLA